MQVHLTASHGRGVGKRPMMNGKQGQFQPIRDACLVIDIAQVIFDHLFGGAKVTGDFLVLEPLNDQSDNLDLLGCEPVADARADCIGFFRDSVSGFCLEIGMPGGDRVNTFQKGGAGDVAKDDAVKPWNRVGME